MSPTMDQPRRAQVAGESTKPTGRRRATDSEPFIAAPASEPLSSTAAPTTAATPTTAAPTTRAAARAAERKRAS